MPRKTKTEVLRAKHEDALIEFDSIQGALRDERLQCLEDRRFYSIAGAQWEGDLGDQFENKPKMEVNKIHLSIIRIINEYRNNRITVDFVSKDGTEDDSLASTCDGLYRSDEQDSSAEEAYDNAFEEAVGGGFGAWRLRTEYEDEEDPEDDRQRIRIEPIYDADSSVFFDLGAKRQDKADATRCYVLTSMTPEAYREEFDEDPATWPKEIHQYEFDWATPDVVFVAELYEKEQVKENIYIWRMLDGSEERFTEDELEEQFERLTATGAQQVRIKKIKSTKIRKYIMSGSRILEDCGYISGKCIPIVPVYGKRWYIDNVERCMGHVRLSRDAQRLKNMQLSKLAEISALSTVEKPVFTAEQIVGHEVMWKEDNIKNYPYLLINPVMDQNGQEILSAPVAYTKPPVVPSAMAALLQITEEDMSDILGNQQNGEMINGNVSTETATLVQNRLDMQTYIYMSNMSKAMRRCGEIWLSMARDVFVEEGRRLKSTGLEGEISPVEILKPVVGDDGEIRYDNDLGKAKFDVVAQVGPSSSTKKASTVRALTNMIQFSDDPETRQVLSSMALLNMEGEGITDVKRYFRQKLIKMGVVTPTELEARQLQKELENAKPDAQEQYLQAAAQKELAEAAEKQANTIYKQAQADKARAETAETLVDIGDKKQDRAVRAIESLGERVSPPSFPSSPVE